MEGFRRRNGRDEEVVEVGKRRIREGKNTRSLGGS